jgi:hypothetical protein
MKKLFLAFALFLATPALAALDDYGTKSITSGTYCKDITRGEATAAIIISGTWTGTGTIQRNDGRLTAGTPINAWGVNVTTRIVVQTFTANGTFLVPIASASQVCVNLGGGPTGTMTIFVDLSLATFPGALAQVTDIGTLTNNNAAPGVNNMGVLPCLANAAVPTWVEGNQVLCSVDLSGRVRVVGTTANDTTAIANGVETQPGVARATPTAVTAGRSEKVQQSATNGAVFTALVGGAATTVVDAFANDTTAVGNGLQVHPGVAKAAPTAITAGRSELLELDAATGAQFVGEVATTAATGVTTTGIATVTASQSIKASAGNLYGFSVVNGAGAGCWLQCVNSAGAGTLGTAVIFQAAIPTSGSVYQSPGPLPLGNFSTGIACGMASAINGASACGTAATGVAIYYK